MSGSSFVQVIQAYVIAAVVVILPWGIPFLIKDVGTLFLPISAVISAVGFLILIGRAVVKGDAPAAVGVLLVPCTMWLLFDILVKRPAEQARADCHLGWTEVQKAQNQRPRHIIVEDFYNDEADYKGAAASEALAILKGAEVLWSVEGSRSTRLIGTLSAKDIALCRIPREEREKGEYANFRFSDEISFDQRTRKIDRCLVKGDGGPEDLKKPDTVIFRMVRLGGLVSDCQAINIIERDSTGTERSLGTVKYDFTGKKLYPEMRKPGDDQKAFPFSFIARAVFGDSVSISALRRHIVD